MIASNYHHEIFNKSLIKSCISGKFVTYLSITNHKIEIIMKGKRIVPLLGFKSTDNNDEVLNFFTSSLKSHFNCTDKQLYEAVKDALYMTGDFFVAHLTIYPYIAVHVFGSKDKLDEHKDWIENKIKSALQTHHVGHH